MTKPNSSEIIVVLDRSTSMRGVKEAMEGGFATFIEQQKQVAGDCRVSLFQFDDPENFERVYTGVPLAMVPPLVLEPRGNTALWDAVGKSIDITGQRLANLPEWERPSKVIFVVITDGQENRSREYSRFMVRSRIEHQEKAYSWSFVYLGSSPTTQADADSIGIHVVSNYVPSGLGVMNMNSVVGAAVASYRVAPNEAVIRNFVPRNIPESPSSAKP